ncbi:MAG TPA: cyclic nucleotide-binding domain-containing protein [Polyangiales bacterium]|jgi:CRP-like cAMP-binding protein|nr:cyclic nucleotide-binding domain-containing protein [Polyangiales bacterium]
MSDASIHAYLAQHPFFQGLPEHYLTLLSSHATLHNFSAQQRVFKQDTAADHFYIVKTGKVQLEIPAISGEPLSVQVVGDNNLLGWSWLIPPYRWLFEARAIVPTTVVSMDGVKLRQACDNDPKLGYDLLRRFAVLMSERLSASRLAAIKQYSGT